MDVGIWTIYNKASHQDHMGNEENLQQQMKYKTRKYVRWNSSLFVNLNKWVKKARRNEWDGASERVRLGQRREVHYVFFILQIDMNELVFFCIYCRHKIITTIRKRLQQYNRRTTDDCKLYARTDTHAKEKNAKSRLGGVGTRECQIATSRQPNILILHSQGVSVYRQTTRMAAAEQPQRHKYTGREKKTAPNTISQQKLHLDWTTRYEFWWCCVSFVSWTSSKNLWISPLQMTLHAFHSNFFSSYLFFFFSWNGFR